jgi:hypothetical protein
MNLGHVYHEAQAMARQVQVKHITSSDNIIKMNHPVLYQFIRDSWGTKDLDTTLSRMILISSTPRVFGTADRRKTIRKPFTFDECTALMFILETHQTQFPGLT